MHILLTRENYVSIISITKEKWLAGAVHAKTKNI